MSVRSREALAWSDIDIELLGRLPADFIERTPPSSCAPS
jgi:hypothetical protein